MSELISIALRFALYLDLMMLFGLGLFGLYGLHAEQRRWLNLRAWMGLTGRLGAGVFGGVAIGHDPIHERGH